MNNTTENLSSDIYLERNIKLTFYLITIVLGLLGNVLVIMVVFSKKTRRNINDIFIMNLAIADLALIVILPIYIYIMFLPFPVSTFFCSFVVPFNTVSFFVSIFTLTSMAIHRCRVILNPFGGGLRQRFALAWIALIWILSFAIMSPLMIVTKPVPPTCEEKWPSMKYRKAYTATLFVLQYLLPLVIIAVAYIRIGLDLNKSQLLCPTWLGGGKQKRRDCKNDANDRARRRENAQVIKTLAIIVLLFAVCMLPIQVGWLLLDFGGTKGERAAESIFKFSIILAIFHSCLNPLVYGTLTKQFRRGYLKYLSYFCGCCKSEMLGRMRNLRLFETEATPVGGRLSTISTNYELNSSSNVFRNNISDAETGSVSAV